jgi:hypothetical protein
MRVDLDQEVIDALEAAIRDSRCDIADEIVEDEVAFQEELESQFREGKNV